MAAPKKPPKERPCVHVACDMVAYMAGSVVGTGAGDHVATLWCTDCGALVYKRYEGGQAVERVVLPRQRAAH